MRIAGAIPDYYRWVQWAYDASPGGTIEIRDYMFAEDLTLDQNVSITIDAGYDCNYSTNTGGVTTINGNMTVSNGSVVIQSGTLEVQ